MILLALLLLAIAAVRWPAIGPLSFYGAWLLPPMAAWLVWRFGDAGWRWALPVLLVPAAVLIAVGDEVQLGGQAALALLALGGAIMARRSASLGDLVRLPPPHPAWAALPLVLPVVISVIAMGGDSGLVVTLDWFARSLLVPVLFIAALRGADPRAYAAAVVLAVGIGFALALAGLGLWRSDPLTLEYDIIGPYHWLALGAAWLSGAAVRRAQLGEPLGGLWSSPTLAALIILALWLDPVQFGLRLDVPVNWGRVSGLALFGAPAALPLAGLVAGALGGMRAAWIVAGAALLTLPLAMAVLYFGGGTVALADPLDAPTVLAWGWLGARLTGRAIVVPSLRVTVLTVLLTGTALAMLADLGELLQFGLAIATAIVTAFVGSWMAQFGKRLGITAEGWLPVLLLPFYIWLAVVAGAPLLDLLREGADTSPARLLDVPLDEALLELAIIGLPLLAAVLVLREMVRGVMAVPKVLRDIRTTLGVT